MGSFLENWRFWPFQSRWTKFDIRFIWRKLLKELEFPLKFPRFDSSFNSITMAAVSSMHEILAMSKKSIFYAPRHTSTRNKTIRMQIGVAEGSIWTHSRGLKKWEQKWALWKFNAWWCSSKSSSSSFDDQTKSWRKNRASFQNDWFSLDSMFWHIRGKLLERLLQRFKRFFFNYFFYFPEESELSGEFFSRRSGFALASCVSTKSRTLVSSPKHCWIFSEWVRLNLLDFEVLSLEENWKILFIYLFLFT